jgi:hypothetical protein
MSCRSRSVQRPNDKYVHDGLWRVHANVELLGVLVALQRQALQPVLLWDGTGRDGTGD